MYYVYILQSKSDGSLYKGMTDTLERRLHEHTLGKCLSTKNKRPLDLVYLESFDSRADARIREKYFKSGIGREVLHEMLDLIE